MFRQNKKIISITIAAGIIVLAGGFLFFSNYHFLQAFIKSNGCAGNVCAREVSLAGRTIKYWYTEHIKPNGVFKIRFQAPASGGMAVNFSAGAFPVQPGGEIIDPPDCSVTKRQQYFMENPDPRSTAETLDCVGISNTKVFTAKSPSENQPIDFVASISLPGIMDGGGYPLEVSFIEFGQATRDNIYFYVDAAAPSGSNESEIFGSVITAESRCADGVDNDLDYVADCRDANCDNLSAGQVGENDVYCRYADEKTLAGEESNCFDRWDNDFDKDGVSERNAFDSLYFDYDAATGVDCRDLDCEDKSGDPDNGENLCWYNNSGVAGEGEAKGYPLSCRDSFNNDIDNGNGVFAATNHYFNKDYYDCADTNCWKLGGLSADSVNHPCPAKENSNSAWCVDGVDNDYDDGINSLDKNSNSGLDCKDYDCRLVEFGEGEYQDPTTGKKYACPFSELINKNGEKDWHLCFDEADNDLDYYIWNETQNKYIFNPEGGIDCGDPDCVGVKNLETGQICYPNEFETGLYQVCGDGRDNDGDDPDGNYIHESSPSGGFDCEDDRHESGQAPDCWQMFGNCGPCPDIEDITYGSCADSLDNDLDGGFDCADGDCAGQLGSLINAASCAADGGEKAAMCFDDFDNDANGATDCADGSCIGAAQVDYYYDLDKECGGESNAELCSDSFDNDGDEARDCLDSGCSGAGDCAGPWKTAACVNVPDYDYPSWKNVSNSISVRQYKNVRIGNEHKLEIRGTGGYTSLQIKIGSKYDSDYDYPYKFCDGTVSKCSVSGTGDWQKIDVLFKCDDATNTTKGYAFLQANSSLGNFILNISCPVPVAPSPAESYLVDVYGNGGAESGSLSLTTTLYEATPPSVTEIEVGGMEEPMQRVIVPYGGTIAWRGVPTDAATGDSGICGCYAEATSWNAFIDNDETPSVYESDAGADCRASLPNITNDDMWDIAVKARDGAGNTGENFNLNSVMIDVVPVPSGDITLERKNKEGNYFKDGQGTELTTLVSPFFRREDKLIFKNAGFRAADNGSFPAFFNAPNNTCRLKITNDSGDEVYSGTAVKTGDGSTTVCSGEYSLRNDLNIENDGIYYLSASVTDNEGFLIESNRKVFYVCNNDPLSYPDGHFCQLADWDQDGAVEGTHAKESLYRNPGLVCDNCPNLFNPDQSDLNANGFGDICEPGGLCVLDSKPCLTDGDCSRNFCSENFCTVSKTTCATDEDCLPNYCDNGIGSCSNNSEEADCVQGLCILDGQCACEPGDLECVAENCICKKTPGYCEGDPAKICLTGKDCLDKCLANGQCQYSGAACAADENCWPICNLGEEGGACSNDPAEVCLRSQDCWSACQLIPQGCSADSDCFIPQVCRSGVCVNLCATDADCSDEEKCLDGICVIGCSTDADCPTGSCVGGACEEKGRCGVSDEECLKDSDCPANVCVDAECSLSGDVCGDNLQCPVNNCDLRYGRCSDNESKVCVEDSDCGIFAYCEKEVGIKLIYDEEKNVIGWEYCYFGEDCVKSWGVCDQSGLICTDDIQCPGENEKCGALGYPWLETQFGGIYTRGSAKAEFVPPTGYYNATYCVRAKGEVVNLTSAAGCYESVDQPFNYPQSVNRFTNIIGKIDLDGINSGQHGKVFQIDSLPTDFALGNNIYISRTGLDVETLRIKNDSGKGLIVVYGDLNIEGNISYNDVPANKLSDLASLGWIVLGNLNIAPSVTEIVGTFYVEGTVSTGSGFNPLTVKGLMLAREFKFERLFASMTRGAESIIYDGRAQANPPPGLVDLTKALPIVKTGR
ncbi:MAG: hypothetical protein PHD51_00405 [Patescibacteria group bacterium]|nr:hypothetical protein [Patescibacteria group bacterium]MDD5490671.1 hypothetical protein [Patescibacteria group bacterium]